MRDRFKPRSGRLVPNYTVIFVVLTLLFLFACVYSVRVLELAIDIQEGQIRLLESARQPADAPQTTEEPEIAITVIVPQSPIEPFETATALPTPMPINTLIRSTEATTNVAFITPSAIGRELTPLPPTPTRTTVPYTPTSRATATMTRTPSPTPTATRTPILPPPAIVLLNAHLDAPEERSNIRLLQWQWIGQTDDVPEDWFYVVRFLDGRNDREPYFTDRIGEISDDAIQFDGTKFTFRWNIFTLPADERSCQPFWQVALASSDPECRLGIFEGEFCLLTEFSTAQNIGAVNPVAVSDCNSDNVETDLPSE